MKGRPLRGNDRHGGGRYDDRSDGASMKDRPLRGGDARTITVTVKQYEPR